MGSEMCIRDRSNIMTRSLSLISALKYLIAFLIQERPVYGHSHEGVSKSLTPKNTRKKADLLQDLPFYVYPTCLIRMNMNEILIREPLLPREKVRMSGASFTKNPDCLCGTTPLPALRATLSQGRGAQKSGLQFPKGRFRSFI